ncbi:MAG: hypothetical protein EXS59_02725 [Candidatus Taylorbacteria bacterium]|nr:hypothetical protein [Candidatus Taylorbacteria bacterium]
MQNDNLVGEKLLSNPLATPELTPGISSVPLVGPDVLVKTTPVHELKNLFGMSPEDHLVPLPGQPIPKPEPIKKNPEDVTFPFIPKPEAKIINVVVVPTEKQSGNFFKFILGILITLITIGIALYIWGGILQTRDAAQDSDTSSQ